VGGIVPGIKLITSGPGVPQQLSVAPLALGPEALEELHRRLVLVYVGYRRLARTFCAW